MKTLWRIHECALARWRISLDAFVCSSREWNGVFENGWLGWLYDMFLFSIYMKVWFSTLHPIHPPMKRTVSSFTSEHLQQSLQHCNESISYDESTGYGGRSSATGNAHLPHHRDRCGRWVSAHLQQEHADFQVYGLPLQMCMWFWMTILYLVIQKSFATKDFMYIHLLFIALCPRDPSLRSGWQDKKRMTMTGYGE